MNEKTPLLSLIEFTTDQTDQPFGNKQGKEALRKLSDRVDGLSQHPVIGLSLKGIEATDASFARESVVALAKQYREDKGFYLQDFKSQDLVDNWNYAALAKVQPMIIWKGHTFEIIGPQPSVSSKALITLVYDKGQVTASEVASALNLSVQNASTNLKNLHTRGYILRHEDNADSGGREFIYVAIRPL